jgi:hypothetical protein
MTRTKCVKVPTSPTLVCGGLSTKALSRCIVGDTFDARPRRCAAGSLYVARGERQETCCLQTFQCTCHPHPPRVLDQKPPSRPKTFRYLPGRKTRRSLRTGWVGGTPRGRAAELNILFLLIRRRWCSRRPELTTPGIVVFRGLGVRV